MPYYIHRSDVTVEALTASLETEPALQFPPDWETNECACGDCCARAWREFWDANPAILYGTKPNPPIPAPALHLAVFDTPADAHSAKKSLQSDTALLVTFVPTAEERNNWRDRERRKVMRAYSPGNARVPWHYDDWYRAPLHDLHNAYLSAAKPGLVAYTPSEEWGVADRQLCVRPGRYLEQFAPHLTTTERDAYCAQVKAVDDANIVHFAKTADQIENVYRNGPDSCMSHALGDYETDGVHPVRVYGESDLQLAYLANEDGKTFRARALVWPEKMIHSRVYGDETIRYLLTKLGYKNGSLVGATVRAIRVSGDTWVMPYVDGIETAELIDGRSKFRFCDEGDYKTQETNGTTEANYEREPDELYICARCDNERDEDEIYCPSCAELHHTCRRCDSEFFEDEPIEVEDYGVLCRGCLRHHTRRCDECADRFCEDAYSLRQQERRENEDVQNFCRACGDDVLEARREEQEREEQARIDKETEEREESERRRTILQQTADALALALRTNGISRYAGVSR